MVLDLALLVTHDFKLVDLLAKEVLEGELRALHTASLSCLLLFLHCVPHLGPDAFNLSVQFLDLLVELSLVGILLALLLGYDGGHLSLKRDLEALVLGSLVIVEFVDPGVFVLLLLLSGLLSLLAFLGSWLVRSLLAASVVLTATVVFAAAMVLALLGGAGSVLTAIALATSAASEATAWGLGFFLCCSGSFGVGVALSLIDLAHIKYVKILYLLDTMTHL